MGYDWKVILGYKPGDKFANVQSRAYYRMKLAQQHNKQLVPQIQKALLNAKKYYDSKPKRASPSTHVGGRVSNANAARFLQAARTRR